MLVLGSPPAAPSPTFSNLLKRLSHPVAPQPFSTFSNLSQPFPTFLKRLSHPRAPQPFPTFSNLSPNLSQPFNLCNLCNLFNLFNLFIQNLSLSLHLKHNHSHGWFGDQPRTPTGSPPPHAPQLTSTRVLLKRAFCRPNKTPKLVLKPTEWDRLTWNDAPAWAQALWASTTAAGTIQIR